MSPSGIGPVEKMNQFVSLLHTAPLLMKDVKVEDVVADNVSGRSVEPSSVGGNAY